MIVVQQVVGSGTGDMCYRYRIKVHCDYFN